MQKKIITFFFEKDSENYKILSKLLICICKHRLHLLTSFHFKEKTPSMQLQWSSKGERPLVANNCSFSLILVKYQNKFNKQKLLNSIWQVFKEKSDTTRYTTYQSLDQSPVSTICYWKVFESHLTTHSCRPVWLCYEVCQELFKSRSFKFFLSVYCDVSSIIHHVFYR